MFMISIKKLIVELDYHFEQGIAFQKENMSRSADE